MSTEQDIADYKRKKFNQYQNKRYAENPKAREQRKASTTKWRKKNSAHVKEYYRNYYKTHKDKFRGYYINKTPHVTGNNVESAK